MKQSEPERKLAADVFDTIDLTSFIYKGIGAGEDFACGLDEVVPLCVHGQACEADAGSTLGPVSAALYGAGITRDMNDKTVRQINARLRRPRNARVDFLTEYVPHLNITRVPQ